MVRLRYIRICSFDRRNGESSVIDVESEEIDWFDIRNPPLHSKYSHKS